MFSIRIALASAAATMMVAGFAATLHAMVCADGPRSEEKWTLSLEDVAIDGESVEVPSEYSGLFFTLEAYHYNTLRFTLTEDRLEGSTQSLSFRASSDSEISFASEEEQ